jgi:hypothetical protein
MDHTENLASSWFPVKGEKASQDSNRRPVGAGRSAGLGGQRAPGRGATRSQGCGAGFTVSVPAGVAIQPGGTQYLTAPKLATPALPAGTGLSVR